MKAATALQLVERYARLTKEIKILKKQIGDSLDLCKGFSGKRNELDESGLRFHPREEDEKGRDKDLHLWDWYRPVLGDNPHWDQYEYQTVTADEHAAECPHCYAAHQAIQARKLARKQLGFVKGAMSKAVTA